MKPANFPGRKTMRKLRAEQGVIVPPFVKMIKMTRARRVEMYAEIGIQAPRGAGGK